MEIQCCVCWKVRTGSTWTAVDHPELVAVHASHGYCPTCASAAFAGLAKVAASRNLFGAQTSSE